MANENHGSPAEEASLMSHSPGTSNQNQPSSPKPMRLVQDLPGTDSASEKAHHRVLKGPSGREGKVECGYWESSGTMLVAVCSNGNGTWMVELSRTGLIVISDCVLRWAGASWLGEVLEQEGESPVLLQPLHQPVPVGNACSGTAWCHCK